MPTKKRKWYPGESYHITARGNHRNDIFKDEQDFSYYLTLIKEAMKYYEYDKYEVICYCLMDNHVHILIKTEDKPAGQFIGRVNSRYAKYFNKKYNYIGNLFSRYIHLNPVRAKMVEKPEIYEWSSYSMYIGNRKENLICSGRLLSYFNSKNKELYKKYVESAISFNTVGNGDILGR